MKQKKKKKKIKTKRKEKFLLPTKATIFMALERKR